MTSKTQKGVATVSRLLLVGSLLLLLASCPNTLIRQGALEYAGQILWRPDGLVDAAGSAGPDYAFGGYVTNVPSVLVDIDGDRAIVGSANDGGSGRGAAYIYIRGATEWTLMNRITAGDGADGDAFGLAVAISGDFAVVGAPYADFTPDPGTEGAAYLFHWDGSNWVEIRKFQSPITATSDEFGWAVSMDGEYVVVGDPAYSTRAGNAHVFARHFPSAESWGFQFQLQPVGLLAGDEFGSALHMDIHMDMALIVAGAYGVSSNTGSAYVFERSGNIWPKVADLAGSEITTNSRFGFSVAIVSGFGAAVGARGQGKVYVFTQVGSTWTESAIVLPSDGSLPDLFGSALSFGRDHLVVAAPKYGIAPTRGAVYPFIPAGSTWVERPVQTFINNTDGLFLGTDGAISVAVSGGEMVVGLPFDDAEGTDAGAARFYYYGLEEGK